MDERKAFLKALTTNEDDVTTRMVYADWLDERGEHEEADRQRKWPAAKAWLVKFAERYSGGRGPGEDEPPVSYPELVQIGHEGLKEGEIYCSFSLCDALLDASEDFWRNWSIVTGVPVPEAVVDDPPFRCAC